MVIKEEALARGVTASIQMEGNGPTTADVLLLLGWTGGPAPLLRKAYASRYLALGMHCLQVATPLPPVLPLEAESVYGPLVRSETWRTLFDGRRKVIVHCFSNGGAINLASLIRITRYEPGQRF